VNCGPDVNVASANVPSLFGDTEPTLSLTLSVVTATLTPAGSARRPCTIAVPGTGAVVEGAVVGADVATTPRGVSTDDPPPQALVTMARATNEPRVRRTRGMLTLQTAAK
jgi:hypothetical protein